MSRSGDLVSFVPGRSSDGNSWALEVRRTDRKGQGFEAQRYPAHSGCGEGSNAQKSGEVAII